MKASLVFLLIAVIAVIIGVTLLNHGTKSGRTLVQAAIQRVRVSTQRFEATPNAAQTQRPSEIHVSVGGMEALSLSSFLPEHSIADLSIEQQARLERLLQQSRKATYELLADMGTVHRLSDGSIRIEIPANAADWDEMEKYIHFGIREIVGEGRMESLRQELGPKFEAKFAYFGRYDTTIDLTVDRVVTTPAAPAYVTMKSAYRGTKFFGVAPASVRMRFTSVYRQTEFESDFFSIERVTSRL